MLPILSTTGVEVVDERPYQLEGLERESYIYDFGLRYSKAMPDHVRELFQDTVAALSGTATTRATGSTPSCSQPA